MTTHADRRLLVVRAVEVAAAGTSQSRTGSYEYEVLVDVAAKGLAKFGPFEICAWEPLTDLPRASYSLVLKLKNPVYEASSASASQSGFFHGSSLVGEICSLLSVILRRRVQLGPMLRRDNEPLRIFTQPSIQNPALIEGTIDLGVVEPAMTALCEVPSDLHEPFLLACRYYQEALELIDTKPDIAYILLVTAIEVLVVRLTQRPTEADFAQRLKDALASVTDADAKKVLVEQLLGDRKISARFVSFISSRLTAEFWKASPKCTPAEGRIEQSEIQDLASRIYNQRSRLLHEGEPFPPNVTSPPNSPAEIDRSSQVTSMGRIWKQRDYIPYVRFFERAVHYILSDFLRAKHPQSEAQPDPS